MSIDKNFYDCGMWLDMAHQYALKNSGCTKVQVGSVIVFDAYDSPAVFGTNRSVPNLCKTRGCLRVEKYGENSKLHRNPEDCRAVHSEIDAIARLSRFPVAGKKTIFITRYPCEACARAIVTAGISVVIYGRKQEISDETRRIFEAGHVECYHCKDWDAEDVTY